MNFARVDSLIQFVLARAAQQADFRHRELGPTQLIKYVYLADLAHAERHDGTTFTGIPWVFLHFGPWDASVSDRLRPAAEAIGAAVRSFTIPESGKEAVRYSLDQDRAENIERALDRTLPLEVSSAVIHALRRFGDDSAGLLEWVYRTPPMLAAAPREVLDFSVLRRPEQPPVGGVVEISRNQEKKLEAALTLARAGFHARLSKGRERPTTSATSSLPRYDDVFGAGSSWLDEEAKVDALEGEVEFPEDIWKSGWRGPHGE